MPRFIEGTISIDRALAFCFGFLFIIIILVFAVAIPEPSDFTLFVFRVILSLAAAGIGAVIPGILEIRVPGIRAGGALALATMVYFMNPPSALRSTLEQRAHSSLNDAYTYIARGNLELARDFIEKAKILDPEPIDVPFWLESYISASMSLRRLRPIFEGH